MRLAAMCVSLFCLALLLSPASAETDGRVLAVEGSLSAFFPGDAQEYDVGVGQEIPAGSRLVASEGSKARVEIPGLGVLLMLGPAEVVLDLVEETPVVRLRSGVARFEFQAGKVLLAAEDGRLEVGSVAGYSGALAPGSSLLLSGDVNAVKVEVRSGASLLSKDQDHVRLVEGDTRVLPPPEMVRGGVEGPTLRSRDVEIQLPPEVVESLEGDRNPALRDFEEAWTKRESPRVP